MTTLGWEQEILEEHGRIGCNRTYVIMRPYTLELAPEPGWTILDVGAYLGANLLHFAGQGHRIVGIEASEEYCKRFEQELAKHPYLTPRPVMIHTMLEHWDSDERFDAALCGEVLPYSLQPSRIVTRIAHFLKPGGILLITTPTVAYPEFPTYVPADVLHDLVLGARFEILWERMLVNIGANKVFGIRARKPEGDE